jgi:hypothetical protein
MLPGTWAAGQMYHALIDSEQGVMPLIGTKHGISAHPNPAWDQIRKGIVRTSAYRRRKAQ